MDKSREVLSAKLGNVLRQLPYLPRTLAMMWRVARPWTITWLVLLVFEGLLPAATVYLTKLVVDGLVKALASGGAWQDVRSVVVLVLMVAGLMVLMEVVRSVLNWIRTVQGEFLQDHITGLIHEKSATADLAFYEFPDYYDHLHRARSEASHRPVALLESLGSLLQNSITLVAMGAILIPLGVWLSVTLILSTLPAFFVVLRYALAQYHWRLRTTEDERRTWYYDSVLTSGENAAELRLFGLARHFQVAYQALRRRLRDERLHLAKRQSVAELLASVLALALAGAALTWMVWKALHGQVTLGDLALTYVAFNQGQRLMRTLLDNVAQLYANTLFLRDLFEFLALQPLIAEPTGDQVKIPNDVIPEIRFERVSFKYPESQRNVLDEFTLTIPAGQVVGIVGPNGAGKTTLMKLLCRFYDPASGSIEINGIDLKEVPTKVLRRFVTALFQQPVHYSTTVRENVEYGDLESRPNLDEIEAAAKAAGVDEILARLPEGYESLLGRWFSGGTELSVGEWQRVALARAFLRRAPIIILDEPTSALDPWAEADWLERFRKLAAGRTAILITHRLTTAMQTDVIHVMEEGRIVESGSHEELLNRNGRYAESWTRQMTSAQLALSREA